LSRTSKTSAPSDSKAETRIESPVLDRVGDGLADRELDLVAVRLAETGVGRRASRPLARLGEGLGLGVDRHRLLLQHRVSSLIPNQG
jgi:hypothetical protein